MIRPPDICDVRARRADVNTNKRCRLFSRRSERTGKFSLSLSLSHRAELPIIVTERSSFANFLTRFSHRSPLILNIVHTNGRPSTHAQKGADRLSLQDRTRGNFLANEGGRDGVIERWKFQAVERRRMTARFFVSLSLSFFFSIRRITARAMRHSDAFRSCSCISNERISL